MSFGHNSRDPSYLLSHNENLIWADLCLMAPLELLWAIAHAAQPPCQNILRAIWFEWTCSRYPLGLHANSPLSSHLLEGLRIYICILYTVRFLFNYWLNFLFQLLLSNYCHCCILTLEMFSRYFSLVNIKHLRTIKHHTPQDSPTSVLMYREGILPW